MLLSSGTIVGHYKILRSIGAGGMGEVYLAEDASLERLVALKVLLAEIAGDDERVRRFEREAKAASALNHPNILTVYEIGQFENQRFIVTEYIKGETLRARLQREPLDLRETLDVTLQIAHALNAAHSAGIVHRDIKPENVMLRDDSLAKVLDFGLAKLTEKKTETSEPEDATRAQVKTTPGMVMGTARYMSPEQARGKEIDARSDIWSLGVVLYEMLTGRTPFAGETTNDTIAAILTKEFAPLDENTPHELQRIVRKALQKKADERYQTVKDFLLDVKNLKRELEFSEELERSHIPSFAKSAHVSTAQPNENATAIHQAVISTADGVAAQSSASINNKSHQTSSAEYVVGEVKKHKFLSLGALAILLLVAVGFGYTFLNRSSGGSINSVAVLPFVNVGGSEDSEYLSDGLTETLINNLSQLPQLKVTARSSSFKYKGEDVDVQDAANKLGVEAIVTGRVVQRGEQLQISVEMVNAGEGTQMWGEQYNRQAADLQTVQSEISREITEKLRLRLTGAQEQQLTKQATQNPEAYQLYLNGLFYERKGGAEGARKALDYYNQATALDPKFALAHAGVADAYRLLANNSLLDPKEAMVKGKAAVQKALEIDDRLAEAHIALAGFKTDEWDWAGAEREYRRTIELNPNLAQARHRYSQYLSYVGRFADALTENKRAQELDPLRVALKSQEGIILYLAHRHDEAIEQLQNALRLEPNDAVSIVYLGYAYAAKGQYAEAINEYQKTISIEGEITSTLCYLGYAYAKSGKRDEALAVLNKLKTTKEYVSPAELAILYVGLGDKEAAFESLERAYAAHDLQLQYLKVDASFDPLRADPRFQDLVHRVGLPQ